MNKLKAYDKLCVILYDPDRFGGTAFVRNFSSFCPRQPCVWYQQRAELGFVRNLLSETSGVRTSFCPNLWQPYRAPLVTLYFHKYTVYSTVQASKHKMTWFFCSQNQEWAMCALKQTVTKAGGCLFLWSDSIPKHASLKNVLIDLWNKYNLRDCPSLR